MHSFHFLRPLWFAALVPLAVLLAVWWRSRRTSRSWQAVVDPRLLPHMLMDGGTGRNAWSVLAVALGGVLAVTALAGPTWSKLQQPVFRRESALVVLLDLSRSMDATDLQPSRLQMAKFKLRDILVRRKEGDTALVVYAADPFVVTPLTNDVDTIERQLSSLTTQLMPVQGSRTDRAIAKAQALLQQSGAVRGDVLLITDGVNNDPPAALRAAVEKLVAAGYRLSVLGVGTDQGAPIPMGDGGFFKDSSGAIVLPKLDEAPLARLAAEGHGIYRAAAAAVAAGGPGISPRLSTDVVCTDLVARTAQRLCLRLAPAMATSRSARGAGHGGASTRTGRQAVQGSTMARRRPLSRRRLPGGAQGPGKTARRRGRLQSRQRPGAPGPISTGAQRLSGRLEDRSGFQGRRLQSRPGKEMAAAAAAKQKAIRRQRPPATAAEVARRLTFT
ncbi:MAG: VWA domain-containing protein [Gammaproteobacteria bacterium]